MVTRPRDQPLFIHGRLPHPGLGVGWRRGAGGRTEEREKGDERGIKIKWPVLGETCRALAFLQGCSDRIIDLPRQAVREETFLFEKQ